MRDILQIIGCILAVGIMIFVDILTVMEFKSSKKDKLAEACLYEGFFRGSAFGMVVLIIFLAISMLF